MSLSGSLEKFDIAGILQLLSNDNMTGVLRVVSGTNEVKVYFMDGTIVSAMESQKENRLGHFLKTKRIITEEQLQQCLKAANKKKRTLDNILVEKICFARNVKPGQ